MGYSWGIGHQPDGPTIDGLRWRWWVRERTVRVSETMLMSAATGVAAVAEVLEQHRHDADGVCADCAAATAELRRLAVDLGEWCR